MKQQLKYILLLLAVLAIIGHSTLNENIHKGQETAEHAAHVTQEKYHEAGHDVKEDVQETINSAKEAAEYAQHRAGEFADQTGDNIRHKMDDIKDKVGRDGLKDRIAHTIQHTLDDAGNLIDQGINRAQEAIHRATHSAEEGVQETGNTIDETAEKVGHRTDEAFQKAGHRIADGPGMVREGIHDAVKPLHMAGEAVKLGTEFKAAKKFGEKVMGKFSGGEGEENAQENEGGNVIENMAEWAKEKGENIREKVRGRFSGDEGAQEGVENVQEQQEGGNVLENLAEWAKEKGENIREKFMGASVQQKAEELRQHFELQEEIDEAARKVHGDNWIKQKAEEIQEALRNAAHGVKDAVDSLDEKFHGHHDEKSDDL